MPCIVVTQGPDRGLTFPLEVDGAVLGRDRACELVVTDEQVSRKHLRFFLRNRLWWVEDLNSSNGTLLNGRRLRQGSLEDGDILLLGETMIGFSLDREPCDPSERDTQTITIDQPGRLEDWGADEDPEASVRARRDLEALYRMGRHINGILQISHLLPAVLDTVFREIGHAQRASVFLYDEADGRFRCAVSRERGELDGDDPEVFSHTMAGQVLQEKAAVLTYDALADERFAAGDSVMSQRIRAAICAPLLVKDRVLGVIYADSTSPRDRFTRDDLRLVGAFGLYAGTALENAQLYEQVADDRAALLAANQELEAAQDRLVQSEKLAAVGRLASGIVHDIRTPMGVILGYAGLVRSRIERQAPGLLASAGLGQVLADIEGGVEHVNGIITRLLAFARPSVGEMVPVDLAALLQETVGFLKHETAHAGVEVAFDLPAALPPVAADPTQLKQVFINIILNGVQAMDGGQGTLHIGAAPARLAGRDAVAVRIRDTGHGMDPGQLTRIFEPFYTTRSRDDGTGGSGLGLSVTYGIVQGHGGRIDVQSAPGEGATFVVTLPVDGRQGAARTE